MDSALNLNETAEQHLRRINLMHQELTALLEEFRTRMQAHGIRVDTVRMHYDRIYAYLMIEHGHASHDTRIQALAVQLFRFYEPGCRTPPAMLH